MLLRFDDVCPTQNWEVWNIVEATLRREQIKPILAVVPENLDDDLKVDASDPNFWDRVREWRDLGWTIAVHGCQHLSSTSRAGIVGINPRSEFAGRSREAQMATLTLAVSILGQQGLKSTVWAAPFHSFDWTTVSVLRDLGFEVVSDGLFRGIRKDRFGLTWVPQQIWRLRKLPAGTWTVCVHINDWTVQDAHQFCAQIAELRPTISSLDAVLAREPAKCLSIIDHLMMRGCALAIKANRWVRQFHRKRETGAAQARAR